jgi:Uma2 family endonuclease
MSRPVSAKAVSVDEYLANPAYEHHEYVAGEIVERNLGSIKHSRVQALCTMELVEYFKTNPIGFACTELHCRMTIQGEVRFRLPDICAVLTREALTSEYLDRAPDVAVEILSPSDALSEQLGKFEDYFANGTRLGWLILPEEHSVIVLTPNAAPHVLGPGQVVGGGELLPGFALPVDELFQGI